MAFVLTQQSPRVQAVWAIVAKLYQETARAQAKYLWHKHIQVVAKFAADLADQHGADVELAVVGAMLHDVADVWLERNSPEFESRTNQTIEQTLAQANFSPTEIAFVTEQVIAPHSCYPASLPTTIEGKILATADAMAHLTTNFYNEVYPLFFQNSMSPRQFQRWAQEKIQRDYENKIFFTEVKEELRPRFLQLVKQFKKPPLPRPLFHERRKK